MILPTFTFNSIVHVRSQCIFMFMCTDNVNASIFPFHILSYVGLIYFSFGQHCNTDLIILSLCEGKIKYCKMSMACKFLTFIVKPQDSRYIYCTKSDEVFYFIMCTADKF